MWGRDSLRRGDDNHPSEDEPNHPTTCYSRINVGRFYDSRWRPWGVGRAGTEEVYSRGRGKHIGEVVSCIYKNMQD